jgi:hypothetical protein
MGTITGFSEKAQNELKFYVYRLVDPRSGKTFYVGKGTKNRVFDHEKDNLNDAEEDSKNETIKNILNDGLEVIKIIHCWGLSKEVALEVEAALINAYQGLTNRAYPSDEPINAKQVEKLFNVEYAEIKHKMLIIKIRHETINERESVYEAVRKSWRIDLENAEQAEYILAVCNGLIVEVYKPKKWKKFEVNSVIRYGFEGKEAPEEIQKLYKGKLIPEKFRKKGAAIPTRYSWDTNSKRGKK